ncbi:MAG: ribosome biogenesis GTP-binding protein YihA/YsxC [Gammaproteobacteria bacterium]|nr:ribosome biogenesis GTP-binding protein YihA/YsxC [Gammaproteobacteria bacterium]
MLNNPYIQAEFLKSAARVEQLPADTGYEVAFAGRSNAGKSSALNCLTANKRLARTSKTPGRTQLINVFTVKDVDHRLIDLPGYGYAKVTLQTKLDWQKHLAHYLEVRASLKCLVILMDCRHPLKESDQMLVQWAVDRGLAIHLILTKADKLSRSQIQQTVQKVRQYCARLPHTTEDYPHPTVQALSTLKKQGIDDLIEVLDHWFEW